MSGNQFMVYDGQGEELGPSTNIDEIPEWENALQRTAKQIAKANAGYIEDLDGKTVYDSDEDDEDDDDTSGMTDGQLADYLAGQAENEPL
jgi:hypothetical protein